VNTSSDHVWIHARAADVFSDVIDDEQIDFFKGQSGKKRAGFQQQFFFTRGDVFRRDQGEFRGFMKLIFEDGQAAKDRSGLEHDRGDIANDALMSEPIRRHMHGRGAGAFAQSNHRHFENAAPEASVKIGVRLDPVQQEDAIGLESFRAAINLHIILTFAEEFDIQRGSDGNAEVGFGDSVFREDASLTFGRGAAMAAHGWNDEGIRSAFFEKLDCRGYDGLKVGDAATSHSHRDAGTRLEVWAERFQFSRDAADDIDGRGGGKCLPDLDHAGERVCLHSGTVLKMGGGFNSGMRGEAADIPQGGRIVSAENRFTAILNLGRVVCGPAATGREETAALISAVFPD
jgi:hypothetical protein